MIYFWDILVPDGYISQKYLKNSKILFMDREFGWQLKLPVAVWGFKNWEFHKSKDQWKYVLYVRKKYLSCHNEVYKGIK